MPEGREDNRIESSSLLKKKPCENPHSWGNMIGKHIKILELGAKKLVNM